MTAFHSKLQRLGAILSLASLASLAGAQEVELISSGPLNYDDSTGEVVATEGAQIAYDNWLLTAETIRFNQETRSAKAIGSVVFSREDMRLTADSLTYRPSDEFARAENFRVGNGKYYVDGAVLEGNPENFRFEDINFYPGEPGTFLFEARAGELSIEDQSVIKGKRLFFKVGPVPFLLIPNITQPLDAETNLFRPTLDYSGHIGAALGAEVLVPVARHLRLGANVTLTSKRGVLAGPAGTYSFSDESNSIDGSLISGYISDQGDPGFDVNGNPIDTERFFAEWKHKQLWDNNRFNVSAYARYWSDSEVTRDFYEDSFDEMQDPDSYLEANYNGRNWQLSLFTRAALGDFQTYTERLPEVRFTYFPTSLGHGFSHSFYASSAKLETEREVSFNTIEEEGIRSQAFYGIEYNKPLRDGINLRLKAGALGIRYDDTKLFVGYPLITDENGSYYDFDNPIYQEQNGERSLGELGADLDFKAYSTFDFRNETWNIEGIRHIIEPKISYRYTPSLDSDPSNSSFLFDDRVFGSYLPEIDMENRRDIDSVFEDHKIRFELKNRIQTRHKNGGARDLARLTFATDYLLPGSSYGENEFNGLHVDFDLTPAPWLEFGFFTRLDPERHLAVDEFNTYVALQDEGYWKIAFGSHFLEGVPLNSTGFPVRLEQYYAHFEYQFSENHKLYATTRYDSETGVFYEQRIGLMQRALERYGLKYELRIYDGDRREDDFGISVGIDLFDE